MTERALTIRYLHSRAACFPVAVFFEVTERTLEVVHSVFSRPISTQQSGYSQIG